MNRTAALLAQIEEIRRLADALVTRADNGMTAADVLRTSNGRFAGRIASGLRAEHELRQVTAFLEPHERHIAHLAANRADPVAIAAYKKQLRYGTRSGYEAIKNHQLTQEHKADIHSLALTPKQQDALVARLGELEVADKTLESAHQHGIITAQLNRHDMKQGRGAAIQERLLPEREATARHNMAVLEARQAHLATLGKRLPNTELESLESYRALVRQYDAGDRSPPKITKPNANESLHEMALRLEGDADRFDKWNRIGYGSVAHPAMRHLSDRLVGSLISHGTLARNADWRLYLQEKQGGQAKPRRLRGEDSQKSSPKKKRK